MDDAAGVENIRRDSRETCVVHNPNLGTKTLNSKMYGQAVEPWY